ncbi:PilN domain-containing protein [uncultured Tissierella sp.]|uniref:PilN domain-containing protein n=1 Tax=uncultured Tissierella sp. TaxID=448160 RepID=UPI002804DBA2|nr:PilN domain-containing protein [uncultured Tissierella sp.]MDU5080042.1 PilN domain-containing protein [Bacillota bacterium]
MRDLNFFQNYIEKNEFKIDKKIIYFTVITFIFLSLIAYTVYNEIIIRQEKRIVVSLRETAEDTKTLKKVEEIRIKEVEVNEFKESVDKIKLLDKNIEERDIVDEALLDKINDNIPEELFLTSLSIQGEEIHIVGISKDKWAIAKFQKGLECIDNYDEIFVSNISKQEDYYNFSLNITLRSVSDDTEDMEEEN